MSKYTAALNKIEEEKSAQNIYHTQSQTSTTYQSPLVPLLTADEAQKKSSLLKLSKVISFVLVIGGIAAGSYFLGKYPLIHSSAEKTLSQSSPFFTIQLITYQSESRAKEQAAKLAMEGHKTFVLPEGGYFQLCSGKFASQNLAYKAWLKLKGRLTDYKDMYVRFIRD